MKPINRAPFMFGAAVILPLIIFFGVQFAFSARDQREAVRAQTLARSERVLVEADGALQRTLGALDVLATARSVNERDWPVLYRRLEEIRDLDSGWVTVRLTDLASGETIFDLRQPLGAGVSSQGFPVPDRRPGVERAFVGDMGGSGPGCPCALAYRFISRDGPPSLLLTAAIDPMPLQRMLAREVEAGRVGAIVDRNGNFVARSLDHRRRVGTPATRYVREVVQGGGQSGIYSGRTWEGFESYTAYSRSHLTGWSAHIAFSTNLLDSPRARSLVAGGFAALASLLLALFLVWITLRQLAEGRRVQERLQEAQKLEALGQITGGIAHDFNNLLTPIVGGLSVIARRVQLDPSSSQLLESALSAGRRAAKLTGKLLAFSRRQRMEIGPVDLARLLNDLKPLLEQSAGAAIRVEIALDEDGLCVESDANQLELALLNLVLNSRDAMPEGGMVAIRARREPPRRNQVMMVRLEIRDEGQGMPREVLRRATEPFFTTKSAGSGTGLGLAQVFGIVRQSGGSLSIDSEPGRGTTVALLLPSCDLPEVPAGDAQAAAAADADAGQRIILCDDDDAVRSFVARALDEAGYVVETVSDGRTAVEIVRNADASLLVIDFAMHGMNGAEVIGAVRAIRPGLPVLMITGYSDTRAVGADIPVLRKPFEANALLNAVREAIDGAGSKAGKGR